MSAVTQIMAPAVNRQSEAIGQDTSKIASRTLPQHPLSAVYPRPNDVEFQNLKDSITNIGVQVPITIHDGQVIDGWSRYCAANEVGSPCPCVELADGVDPRDFAKSQACRRNLTAAQTAMVITAIYQWHPPHRKQGHTQCEVKTNVQLAELASVHANTISQAKVVQKRASSEVQAAVRSGEIGLPKAVAIAKMPSDQQAAAINKPLPKRRPAKHDQAEDIAFREVAASSKPTHDAEPENTGPDSDELAAQEATEAADRLAMQKLVDSDEKLATAMAEIQRLNAEVSQLKITCEGHMNRANEAIKLVNKGKLQIHKLRKQLASLKKEPT